MKITEAHLPLCFCGKPRISSQKRRGNGVSVIFTLHRNSSQGAAGWGCCVGVWVCCVVVVVVAAAAAVVVVVVVVSVVVVAVVAVVAVVVVVVSPHYSALLVTRK